MSTDPTTVWQTKLAARLHDPAEKALVLLRDPAGHENGTSRALARLLGYHELGEQVDPDNDAALIQTLIAKAGFGAQLPQSMYRHVQRADWWAAAADRPQWPVEEKTLPDGRKVLAQPGWAQVRWAKRPVLIHPLTGDTLDLGSLDETDVTELKQRSFDHFAGLIAAIAAQSPGAAPDWRKLLLALWRFGPELSEEADNGKLGALWPLLPADTRIPDHTIWDHLDLTSAFAGAFAADPEGEAALLALSIGPVQPFIEAARKVDDLWAGSHLLARLSWEAMRAVAEALGPDAILFPRLRGIPQVDLWLRDTMGLPDALFASADWMKDGTDANPLFAAALPNRFVAVVPASQARSLAEKATAAVRHWLQNLGQDVVLRLLHEAGFDKEATLTPYEQMREQLQGFPEVHWAAVPFSLIRCRDEARQRDLDATGLLAAMAPFFGQAAGAACGFLDSPAWKTLSRELKLSDNQTFFAPNPGALYPAVYDLSERLVAAAKSVRTFEQRAQEGWRDSLSGEAEWLTTDRAQLGLPPGQRTDTLWTRISNTKPAWAREGEHLNALSAIKRLWPTVFAEEVGKALAAGERGEQKTIGHFVVSTHTMALAHQLDQWLERGGLTETGTAEAPRGFGTAALPRRLVRRHADKAALNDAKRLPALLESEQDKGDDALERARWLVKKTLGTALGDREIRLETYYGLLMMDGDRMGAILSGDEKTAITYRESFHPDVRQGFENLMRQHPSLAAYGQQKRAISPNRHLAVSAALNDFSQTVARHVVEEEHLGRLIYAGGDDVLAMLPVADLLPCAQRLRHAYSGTAPEDPEDEVQDWGVLKKDRKGLHCKGGFAWLQGRLMRMMGRHATASVGLVIAHHQAPLSAVLRELRATEKRAKNEGGRDAFALTVVKRSGGTVQFTAKWGEPLLLLQDLIGYLRDEGTSRRAVYHSLEWLKDLPPPGTDSAMLQSLLAYQLARQSEGKAKAAAPGLAARLAAATLARKDATEQSLKKTRAPVAAQAAGEDALRWLASLLSVAEFLAREVRSTPQAAAPAQENAA